MRDVTLSLLAKEPAHGYELRQRLVQALGPAGGALNPGQVYVTLSRLERAGLVRATEVAQASHPDKKVYELTAAGRERVQQWLTDAQRLELLRELHQLQELALAEPADGDGALLLEGASLRLQADIRWLEACERRWLERGSR
jgi:DNA-binding PadR family transcriptional regulator